MLKDVGIDEFLSYYNSKVKIIKTTDEENE